MKTIFALQIALYLSFLGFGQTLDNQQSNAEKFSAKTGTLIQKEYIEIGELMEVEIQVLKVDDLLSSDSIQSVRLKYTATDKYSKSSKIAVLDSDEVSDLLKALDYLLNEIVGSSVENYTEIIFQSRGGFETGCFYSKGSWSYYIKLVKSDSKSYVFMEKANLLELKALMEEAFTVIN